MRASSSAQPTEEKKEAMLASREDDLQRMVDELNSITKEHEMKVNTTKLKITKINERRI